MLTITKNSVSREAIPATAKTISVDYPLLVDTAFSYMEPRFAVKAKGQSRCKICDALTGASNRHICPSCWGTYEEELYNAMKNGTTDLVVDIE